MVHQMCTVLCVILARELNSENVIDSSSNINALTRGFVSKLEITAKLSMAMVRTAQNNAPSRLYVWRMPLTDAHAPARALSRSVVVIATTYG